MFKKSSAWLIVLIAIAAFALIATGGCSKRQTLKLQESEMAAAKPEAAPEEAAAPEEPAKEEVAPPEEAAPAPAEEAAEEQPKAEEAAPAEEQPQEAVAAPEEEAKPAAEAIDLSSLRIQFAFDDYSLSNKAKENLEAISAWLSKNPDAKIQIQGNTCDIGTAEYNLALGDRRAQSAKTYLEGLGVDSGRLSTISYGFEKPLVPNTNEGNRSQNRRDEFVESK